MKRVKGQVKKISNNLSRTTAFGLVLIGMVMLTGCWGAKEIDEAAYILALGIDSGPGQNLTISTVIDNPGRNLTGAGTMSQSLSPNRVRVFTTEAPTVFSALNIINSILERQIELGHLKMVIFGEPLARQGIESHIDVLVRWRKLRRTIYIAVAQGEARRVIECVVPPAGDNAARLLEMMFTAQGYVGYTPRNQMLKFYNAMKTKGEDPIAAMVAPRATVYDLPAVRETRVPTGATGLSTDTGDPGKYTAGNPPLDGSGSLQFSGTAVFRHDKMIQKLTGNETLALLLLRGEFSRAFISVPDPEVPGKMIQVEISQSKRPYIRIHKNGDRLKAKVLLKILNETVGIQSHQQYELPQKIHRLEQSVEKWIKTQCNSVFQKARIAGTDIFGFGNYARWLAPDWDSWRKWDWNKSFQSMELDLKVKVHVNRTGLLLKKNAVKGD